MLLATEADVLARGGLGERSGSITTINAALLAAHPALENTIGTIFTREDRVDYFGGLRNQGDSTYPEYLLNLTNGIIDADETVRLWVSSDGQPIVALSGANANVERVDASLFQVNHQGGRVTAYLSGFNGFDPRKRKMVAVRYISGFDVDGEDIANQEQVPKAIHEAAITMAIRNSRASSATKPKINTLEARDELSRMARNLVSPFIRTRLLGDHPQFTEIK